MMGLLVQMTEPAVPACADCMFLYGDTCANAETADQDKPKTEPLVCELRIPFKAEPPGGEV